jgi:hypothetical protein
MTSWSMKTILDFDEGVLRTAKKMAAKEKRSAGAVISDLARRGFRATPGVESRKDRERNGAHLLPSRDETVTLSLVRKIMEEEGI